ncbi:MAG: hypothetical protein EA370_08705 [Wenzhouxiangella sp.]|nr:MAG: hypothetical protein EA370_08705 [Wenzhouxiangella sp.]
MQQVQRLGNCRTALWRYFSGRQPEAFLQINAIKSVIQLDQATSGVVVVPDESEATTGRPLPAFKPGCKHRCALDQRS